MAGKNDGFTLVELIVIVAILGILLAVLMPNYIGIQAERAREAAVKSQVHVTQLAVEDAAVIANGQYANDVADFKTSLPDSTGFMNPFTGSRELPQDGQADESGEVGYELVELDRYEITGYGKDTTVLLTTNGS